MIDRTEHIVDENAHPAHKAHKWWKTLVLLKMTDVEMGPVFFVVESITTETDAPPDDEYFYTESQCPTNFIGVAAVMTPEEDDPHGCFDYVRTAWMPSDYEAKGVDQKAVIRRVFPEIDAAKETPC